MALTDYGVSPDKFHGAEEVLVNALELAISCPFRLGQSVLVQFKPNHSVRHFSHPSTFEEIESDIQCTLQVDRRPRLCIVYATTGVFPVEQSYVADYVRIDWVRSAL